MSAYMHEAPSERAARLDYENDQLVSELNSKERLYQRLLAENGRLRAELEEAALRLSTLQTRVQQTQDPVASIAVLETELREMNHRVCRHSDACADFEDHLQRPQVYLPDD